MANELKLDPNSGQKYVDRVAKGTMSKVKQMVADAGPQLEDGRVMHTNSQNITREKLIKAMPRKCNAQVTDAILDKIHRAGELGLHQELFEEQILTYTDLLGPGIGWEQLMNAIKFVSLRDIMRNQEKAYSIVFPDTADRKAREGMNVASLAAEYSKTKVVVELVSRQMLAPSIKYQSLQDVFIKKFVDLSSGVGAKPDDYVSPTVQLNAAIAGYEAVKTPEAQLITINSGTSDAHVEATNNLADQMKNMIVLQQARMANGESIEDVQKMNVVVEAAQIEE